MALACCQNIPIVSLKSAAATSERKFYLEPLNDRLIIQLLKMQSLRKKQLIYASSEALGKILARQPELVRMSVPYLKANFPKDRHDIFVNVVLRITRAFPQLLCEKLIFEMLTSFVGILTNSMRAAIFDSLTHFYEVASETDKNSILFALSQF